MRTSPSPGPNRPGTRRHRLRTALVAALGSGALVLMTPAVASAEVIPKLPQNATGFEQAFSPAYDYDKDGCYATAAISGDGRLNPGLAPGGAVNGHCRDMAQLDNANTYSRGKCDNGWCAVMYASYFEKDQSAAGVAGHRHDFEHVVVWVKDNQVQYVSTSQHSGWKWYPRSQVRFDGTHPKVVYHKDGASTHFFRLANSGDDRVENHTGNWFFPRLVGWGGYPGGYRDRLMNANFGAASIKITDGRLGDALNAAKPPIQFNAYA
ncbi:NPP1 family protein [Streptomyces brasiliscabiei]|uniref:NPP1 family protein n=1 Tax=Streptomyces brasiliscabiei TaxID=2736302 RepID=A0ABU8G8Y5_9ACTN